MDICVVGTGYVGLVTGAGFAETGQRVTCVDIEQSKIDRLSRGELPIFEPGLDDLVERNVEAGRLRFSSDVSSHLKAARVIFVCVGTPMGEDGSANLAAVDAVARQVGEVVERDTVLVMKSTVPVGTNARVRAILGDKCRQIRVVSNPEFLKEGDAVNDFLRPDRIVIGCDRAEPFAADTMSRLYHPLCLDRDRILWMDPASAELTKYVANTMLAMRISFMNEVAQLCDRVGADVHHVRVGVGSDSRIGNKFLYAGPGYGGSCFPKDVLALVHTSETHGVPLELAATTHRVNLRQKAYVVSRLRELVGHDLTGHRVAVWGVAFKPRTDDIRESPALSLIDALMAQGAIVIAHDPEAGHEVQRHYGDRVQLVDDAYAAVDGAAALVLVTEWRQYQNPDFDRLKALLVRPVLFDTRNIWSSYRLREQGFIYSGIGVRGS